MRALIVVSLFLVTGLAGCFSDGSDDTVTPPASTLDPDRIKVPVSARLNASNLEWIDVTLPFSEVITLPEGATMVRFVADPGSAATISVSMSHNETGRRRCNQQPVVGFGQTFVGVKSCSSVAAIDPPGTEWRIAASGPATADLRVEFLATPLDGPTALLDLSLLSHATYDLHPTEYLRVPGANGDLLWVEVTLPVGPGPWPTVIASSPYNGEQQAANRGVTPAMWTYWTQDYAKRGYAAVNVDVRGYGMSDGCVEVWGANEQLDQKLIVDWVAKQPWSDGNVGFYGQSYVGTTPVAAAVQAPEALKAIIAVAPVISAYDDWHYGGVPNGESALSPVAYQVLTATPEAPDPSQATDLVALLNQATSGVCDPTLLPLANSPTAEYNEEFYGVRDFKRRAANVQAAVLFTEGFEDANVKSAMIPGWFNELTSPKLGVFGHWLHQHPARLDAEVLFLGWMDQYVKGRPIGFENFPNAIISADKDWHRTSDSWPSLDATQFEMGLDFGANKLDAATGAGSFALNMNPVQSVAEIQDGAVVLEGVVETDMGIHAPSLHLEGNMVGENGFVYASLVQVFPDGGQRLITWGMLNLALRNGYDNYQPAAGAISGDLPFRPTEHVIEAGSTLRLLIRGVQAGEAIGLAQPQPAQFTLDGSASKLVLPSFGLNAYDPMPITALP